MWPNPQETADLVPFTEEILNEQLLFCVQCSEDISVFRTFLHLTVARNDAMFLQ